MSDIKARYVGHPEGCYLPTVPVGDGETRGVRIPYGGELPTEIDGLPVPASYRNSLLEQKDSWTEVRREAPKKTTAAKADEKEE
jgi:hypothetical protein